MVKTNDVTVLETEQKKFNASRKFKKIIFIALLVMLACSSGAFAASSDGFKIEALDSLGDVLTGALQSTWLKAILATALVIEFGVAAWGQSKGASELVSGAVKWMFATGGMLGATGIANFIFSEVQVDDISAVINAMPISLG